MEISEPQAAVQNREVAEELLRLLRSLNEKLAGENVPVEERPSAKAREQSPRDEPELPPDGNEMDRRKDNAGLFRWYEHTHPGQDFIGRSHRVVYLRNGY